MKGLLVAALVPSILGLAAADGLAQQRPAAPPAERPVTDRPAERKEAGPAFTMPAGAYESDRIVGTKVKDAQGKDIGEIDALIIDSQEGKVTHAVIGKGGVLGIGASKVVVPWSEVQMTTDRDGDRVAITMEESKLENAPRYERRQAARDRAPAASPGTTPAPAERR
jgi:sporulation protein YlmC with PRC-barrel domain